MEADPTSRKTEPLAERPSSGIRFEEARLDPAAIARELADLRERKEAPLPGAAARTLRRQQMGRLETNIRLLRKKQEEFNRKMEEYIQNIRALIGSLEREEAAEDGAGPAGETPEPSAGTHVRCLGCGEEKMFDGVRVISPGSRSSLDRAADFVVDDGGTIRKGRFSCARCGSGNLVIRRQATPPRRSRPRA
jgi:hypothetical protein